MSQQKPDTTGFSAELQWQVLSYDIFLIFDFAINQRTRKDSWKNLQQHGRQGMELEMVGPWNNAACSVPRTDGNGI